MTLARNVPDFDGLARVYAPLEFVSFGRALARRRFRFLAIPELATAKRALVLGDGDGRFTAALLERYPALEMTAVDASAAMLGQLEARVRRRSPSASLQLHHADARAWVPPPTTYDVVATHFFFDCFTTEEVRALVATLEPSLAPDARWLVSEFAVPTRGASALLAWLVVRGLYFAFRVLTGLRVTRVPEYGSALEAAGFVRTTLETSLGGMLRSELWERP